MIVPMILRLESNNLQLFSVQGKSIAIEWRIDDFEQSLLTSSIDIYLKSEVHIWPHFLNLATALDS